MTLKAARTNKGLTQQEAANLLGISRNTLIAYEFGKRLPNVRKLKRIEDIYEINFKDIDFITIDRK